MEKVLLVGADVHDQSIRLRYAVGRDEDQGRSFANRRKVWPKMVEWLREEARRAGAERIVFAYEASGVGFKLHDFLRGAGVECHVLAPSQMKRAPQDRRDKTDDKDAGRVLAELRGHVLAGNELPDVWVPDEGTRDAREVVRARVDVGEKITRVKVQVQALLKRQGVEKPEGLGENWTRKYRAWLLGQEGPRGVLPPGARWVLGSLRRQLEALEEEAGQLDEAVAAWAARPRYAEAVKALDALAGVGLLTAMVFLTEMGEVGRFDNRREVGSFMGLAPSSHESGEAQDRKGHITRQGSSRLRRVLCQATWARIRTDPETRAFYERLVGRNPKKKMIAVVACMRRLGVRMWHRAVEATQSA